MKQILYTALLLLPLSVGAQRMNNSKPEIKNVFLGVSITGGVTGFNANSTNDMLNMYGLPQMRDAAIFQYGAQFSFGMYNRFFTSLNVNGSRYKKEKNGTKLEQGQSCFDINLNYTLLGGRKTNHFLFGGLGFGWQTNQLKLISNPGNITFGSSLLLPGNEKTYTNKNLYYINAQVGYDYALDARKSMLIGARAGYHIGLNKRSWKMSDNNINNSPEMNAGGYFAQLALTVCLREK